MKHRLRRRRASSNDSVQEQQAKVIAKAHRLTYSLDRRPGFRRMRSGRGFRFCRSNGTQIRDVATLRRIRALAIPPAWTDVWICPKASGHLQATGRDARGRKQYRYHERWRSVRDDAKFDHVIEFGKMLPRIRRRVREDLRRRGLPREKVLATVIRLLETTLIRVGNEEYCRTNGSFGLTTLRDRHVHLSSNSVRFEFRGKSDKKHSIAVHSKKLARIVRQCRDLPGQMLFQFRDEAGVRHTITSTDVNCYLREITNRDFTAKDFRTWAGTVLAFESFGEAKTRGSTKARSTIRVIRQVADRLGNTPAVCRKCYIHPAVIGAFENNHLPQGQPRSNGDSHTNRACERALLRFLKSVT